MSNALTDAELLTIWERGSALGAADRALLIIGTADPGAEAARTRTWPLGRRDARLLQIREATFGASIHFCATCPHCHTNVEFDVNVRDLQLGEPIAAEIEARIDMFRVVARLPTSEDSGLLERFTSAAAAETALWDRCVRATDDAGDAISASALSSEQRAQVEALLERVDPQTDVAFDLRCAHCDSAWTAPCDVAGLVWQEITQCAREVLVQTSALARAFGWTEPDILALSRRRREMYLAAVG